MTNDTDTTDADTDTTTETCDRHGITRHTGICSGCPVCYLKSDVRTLESRVRRLEHDLQTTDADD